MNFSAAIGTDNEWLQFEMVILHFLELFFLYGTVNIRYDIISRRVRCSQQKHTSIVVDRVILTFEVALDHPPT